MTRTLAVVFFTFALALPAQASWWESLFGGDEPAADTEANDAATTDDAAADDAPQQPELSNSAVESGLRTALEQGTRAAVDYLGREDGFWGNADARIPLPPGLDGAAELVRKVGGGNAVDEFHMTLNRAAEQAVPQAAEVFTQTVRGMTLTDVQAILAGGDDAATHFFRDRTETELAQRFRPIVAESVQSVGVGNAYQSLVNQAGPYASALGAPEDLEGYVTEHALDALYTRVAAEEAAIRANPLGRGSEILEQVFGRGG